MLALTDHPDQRELWVADFDGVSPTAVEEIVRWATPVIHFRRTATRDTVVGGQEIKAGEKVVMFYNSANRDERAVRRPVPLRRHARRPTSTSGFGAGGPHFCLGANLARREIRVMFEELLRRLPDLEITGEPDLLQSGFIHGIKRMPCAWNTVNARVKLAWGEEDEAFRAELLAFLDAHTPPELGGSGYDFQGDVADERRARPAVDARLAGDALRPRLDDPRLPARARRPQLHAGADAHLPRDAREPPASRAPVTSPATRSSRRACSSSATTSRRRSRPRRSAATRSGASA